MNQRMPIGGITVNTFDGETIGLKQSELNDNIFIDTDYRSDAPRCYTIKKGTHKGKKMYMQRIKKIQP